MGGLVSWTGWVGASRVWFGSPSSRDVSLRLTTYTPGKESELTAPHQHGEKKGWGGQMMPWRALGIERRI